MWFYDDIVIEEWKRGEDKVKSYEERRWDEMRGEERGREERGGEGERRGVGKVKRYL